MNAVTSTLGKPSKPGAFKWLIKREFWENRGGFFWAPVITGGIFLVLNLILAVIGSIAARRSMDGGGFVIDDAPEKAHQIVGGIGDGMLLGRLGFAGVLFDALEDGLSLVCGMVIEAIRVDPSQLVPNGEGVDADVTSPAGHG